MMNKVKIPQLRFSEFDGPWNKASLGAIGDFKNGLNKSKKDFGFGKPFVNLMDVFGKDIVDNSELSLVNASEKDLKNYNLKEGDVLFIRSSVKREGVGQAVLVPKNLTDTVYSGFLIRFRERANILNDEFKRYCFSTKSFRKELLSYATSSANTNINQESLEQLTLYYPSQKEQLKIAGFLSSVDQKITQLRQKKKLLEEYKKGVMQKLFSQEIRFKDENGENFPDWEYKELGDISDRITDKNHNEEYDFVLTNSAVEGVVSQTDYFDKQIANKKNLDGYYIVKKDDFVYNPRISSEAPVGPIKRNKLKIGVMSPLYSVFRIKEKNLDYFEYFFETAHWHRYMYSVANIGARHDRMNITVDDFKKLPIPVPSVKERDRITDFINSMSDKLAVVNQELELAEEFKKGLLQQMLV